MEIVPADKVPVQRKSGKIQLVRKRTNGEIIADSLRKSGDINIRCTFQIYDPETGKMAGLNGKSFSFKVKSAAAVEKAIAAMVNALENLK